MLVTVEVLVTQVSRSQQDQTNLEKELGLASDHVILLTAKHQKAVDRATELEEKVQGICDNINDFWVHES